MTTQLIEVYKTSDGEYFEKEEEARAHEANLEFMNWYRKNICCGGPWSYDMVARAILDLGGQGQMTDNEKRTYKNGYEAGKLAERERIIHLLENIGFQRARVTLEPNGGKDDKG